MNTYDINSNDPMEVIWAVREQINEETRDMSWEEFHEYVRKGSERGREEIERHRKQRHAESVG